MKATVTIDLEEYNKLLSLKKVFDRKEKIIFHTCDGYFSGSIAIDEKFRKKAKSILYDILNDDDSLWKKTEIKETKVSFIKKIIDQL